MRPWDNNTVVFELEIVVQLLLFHDNNIRIRMKKKKGIEIKIRKKLIKSIS